MTPDAHAASGNGPSGDVRAVDLASESAWFDGLDQPERHYPVRVEVTNYYIVWVEGDSPESAVKTMQNEGDWYERLPRTAYDADATFHAADSWDLDNDDTQIVGPLPATCAECGVPWHRSSRWFACYHRTDCSQREEAKSA